MRSSLGGLRGLSAESRALLDRADGVLAVVVSTQGSTYRKRGAMVLLDESGVRFGALSGGCLEPALERQARSVLASGRAESFLFDTSDPSDRVFGSGLGCIGRADALLLPVRRASEAHVLVALERALGSGDPLSLSFSLDEESLGAGRAEAGGFSCQWNVRGERVAAGSECSGPHATLEVPSPPRLLLLGAGPETPTLLAFTRALGWFADVVETRGRFLVPVREAGADLVHELPPDAAFEALSARRFDAILVMSHSYETDLAHLSHWADTPVDFLGLIGPVARREALLRELGDRARKLQPRLRGPVGLPLGGDGPEAIALSVVAQLQRHFSGGRGD